VRALLRSGRCVLFKAGEREHALRRSVCERGMPLRFVSLLCLSGVRLRGRYEYTIQASAAHKKKKVAAARGSAAPGPPGGVAAKAAAAKGGDGAAVGGERQVAPELELA